MGQIDGPKEAVESWAHAWEPTNFAGAASAQKVRLLLRDAADFDDTQHQAWSTVAGKIEENVLLDDGSAELLHKVASNHRQQAEAVREIGADLDRIHADRLANMRNDDPRAASWDWKGNQDEEVGAS